MDKSKIIYLIDGSAYIYRAYHAIRNLSNSKGLPTNAILGFTKMLMKLMEDRKPEFAAMVFDVKAPTFRHDLYAEYKANRPPMPEDLSIQIPYIKEITKGFNIPVIEKAGYEADDLMGTLARLAEREHFSVMLVSGDKDFIQLVTENTTIWDPMKDKLTDLSTIRESFTLDPSQIIDVMGLSGDTADNVPGVPGIGPKTAVSLIQTFGSMTDLYDRIDTITKKKQRENLILFKDQALLSRVLVTIDTDAPIEFDPPLFKLPAPDNAVLLKLFKELEFRQLQQTIPHETDLSNKTYHSITRIEDLTNLITRLEKAEYIALDTETTSKNPMEARLVGLSFSCTQDEGFYIPVGHDYPDAPEQLECAEVLTRLKPILDNPDIKKIGQNIKYDWMVLLRHGADLSGVVFDTMLASYLINPSKRAHGLDRIALDFLDHHMITYQEVTGKGSKAINFSEVPIDKAVPYACEDADITFSAFQKLRPMLETAGLLNLLDAVEMPLVPVLMRMEMQGIRVDEEKLHTLSVSLEQQLNQIEKDITLQAGETFNIRSSQQLGKILFEKLNLPIQKKTKKKTGYSTDVDVLKNLSELHELPALVLKHRTLAKLKSTYTDALLDLVHPETGRIHTSYNQTVTATGRLSSSNPNLQNIPVRNDEGLEIRRAFLPKKGWCLVSADYSQIELRILAHYSNDRILIQAFNNDEDIHTRTANEVFQLIPSMITPEVRRQAKAINFGIIYGMSPFGLSKNLGISQKMAKTYIDSYFSRYKGVKQFIEHTTAETRNTKQTSTLLGRIRLLPDIDSKNRNLRQFAERIAINTPIQGTAADLIKLAMIKVDDRFRKQGLKSAMLLTVHDELIFEVPSDELDHVKNHVKKIMEGIWDLSVPLKVNLAWGENWAEAH